MRWIVFGLLVVAAGCDDGESSAPDQPVDASMPGPDEGPPPPDSGLAFPEGFMFGTATAGFQVEMGCPTVPAEDCEDRHSDWYQFITSPETLESSTAHLSGEPPSGGPGHWELYEQDFDLARDELKNNAYRLSIEWSRIFPVATDDADDPESLRALADETAIQHYHSVLAALRARDMTPLVTVNHYTLPDWLHDGVSCHVDASSCSHRGWVDKDRTVREIAKFAGFLAREFGDEVDLWVTLNEPFALLLPGYLIPNAERTNPPARTLAIEDALTVLEGLVEAHARIYDAIHANDEVARVGVVYNLTPARPKDPENPLDVEAAHEALTWTFSEFFADPSRVDALSSLVDVDSVHGTHWLDGLP